MDIQSVSNKDKEILEDFLDIWPLERVATMNLSEYTDLGNQKTFTQYVENKTRTLGSIKGLNSIQFGIYRKGSDSKDPKRNMTDGIYIWRKRFNADSAESAFELLRSDILKVIGYAIEGDLEAIDKIGMYNMYKWKIAFLYSHEAFVPIYNLEILKRISQNLSFLHNKKTKTFEYHRYIISTKPFGLSVFEYMRTLFKQQGIEIKGAEIKNKKRKAAEELNDGPYNRQFSIKTKVIQFHKKLQKQLISSLNKQHYPYLAVPEENHIDVKLELENDIHYYEVKTDSRVEECIRQGLGQLLSYVHFEKSTKHKKLFIAGKSSPNPSDLEFINFIKNQFADLNFDYFQITEDVAKE